MDMRLKILIIVLIGNDKANHYVIVLKKNIKYITILDPATGQKKRILFKKFEEIFLNIIIEVQKTSYKHKKVKVNSIFIIFNSCLQLIPWLAISTIFSIVSLFLSSFLMKIIFDSVIPSGSNKLLVSLVSGFFVITILGSLNNGFKNFIVYKVSLKISFELIEKFNYKLSKASSLDIEKLKTVDILRRMNLIDPIALFLSSTLFSIFGEIITSILAASILIWIDLQLFMFVLLSTIMILAVSWVIQIIVNGEYGKFIEKQLDYSSNTMDLVHSIKTLKNTDTNYMLFKKYNDSLYKYKKQDKKIWILNNLKNTIENLILSLTSIAIIALSTIKVINLKLTIGSMIMFTSLFKYFIGPIKSTSNIYIKYPLVKKEINLLMYIFNLKEEKLNIKGHKVDKIKVIHLQRLSFYYELGKKIIDIEDFKIKTSIQITGQNGSGKTTILEILSFLHYMDGIKINNIDLKYHSLEFLRNKVTHIRQRYMPNQTILQYVTSDNLQKQERLMHILQNKKLIMIMDKLKINLHTALFNNGSNVSSGQRQFIELLKIFTNTYDLILLDEAFEHLSAEIFSIIKPIIKKECKTSIFIEVSHSKRYIAKEKEVLIETFK